VLVAEHEILLGILTNLLQAMNPSTP